MTPVALLAVVLLLWMTPAGPATTGSATFAAAVFLNFAVSAALHCGRWTPRAERILTRLDHATIFLVIAAAYTSVATLLVRGQDRAILLIIVWTGAAAGVVAGLLWSVARRRLRVAVCLALGLVPVAFLQDVTRHARPDVLVLLGCAGLLYLAGAVVYAVRRPDPLPTWFGFHEVFHTLIVLAFAAQSAALVVAARSLLPSGSA